MSEILHALSHGLAEEIAARTPDDTTAVPTVGTDFINDDEYLIIITRVGERASYAKEVELVLYLEDHATVSIISREWHRTLTCDINKHQSIEEAIRSITEDMLKGLP